MVMPERRADSPLVKADPAKPPVMRDSGRREASRLSLELEKGLSLFNAAFSLLLDAADVKFNHKYLRILTS